ncbi:helix-turn-helix transcriptional regulator [Streptacidiphilus sp. 4-A2]|nr:helix-turn-helix transcriptional regulator [Streptacidiphilus sp. 4-A2]
MSPTEGMREITDLEALAATAHPLRRRLQDLLEVEGPATAAQLAGRTRQPVENIVRHLGILAQTRIVEEADGPAGGPDGRPWQLSAAQTQTQTNGLADDPVTRAVIVAMLSVLHERHSQFLRDWLEGARPSPRSGRSADSRRTGGCG